MVEGGVPFAMLSDSGGEIGKVYGVYDEGAGVDIRGRFLIDPDGVIQAMEVMSPPVGRNMEELLTLQRDLRCIDVFLYAPSSM
jgi:peroxiredoxin (alkyl hydroperoxide reductase subunit C)